MIIWKRLLKNWSSVVTLIGVILVFAIVLSGVDAMYILVVLGAMNCLYGVYSIVTRKPLMKTEILTEQKANPRYTLSMGICQVVMGIFVLAMGVIYILDIIPGQYFWDVVLCGIVVLMICWYMIRLRSQK